MDGDLVLRVGLIFALEGFRVDTAGDAQYVWMEAAVEPLDLLRSQVAQACLDVLRVGHGEELGGYRDDVEDGQDTGCDEGGPVPPKAPPHELPLRGDEYLLILLGGNRRCPFYCLGHGPS